MIAFKNEKEIEANYTATLNLIEKRKDDIDTIQDNTPLAFAAIIVHQIPDPNSSGKLVYKLRLTEDKFFNRNSQKEVGPGTCKNRITN